VHGYVLHDFARADAGRLDALLDAVAEAAARLAKGDQARFLSEVAHRYGEATGAAAGKAPKAAPDPAPAPAGGRQRPGTAHPAGERMSKRQGALADNLARWLKLRDRSQD
jgi:PTH1 family peptidyl-tRNA hydrolase